MEKLQVNMFCSKPERFKFSLKSYSEISKSENRKQLILCIHSEANTVDLWKSYLTNNKPDFNVQLVLHKTPSYLEKVYYAHKSSCKYSCKLDDDTLVSSHVWDFIIENLDSISSDAPIIAPILTNGIPTVEFFIEDFLNEEEKAKAYEILLRGRINPNEWGLNYNPVNNKVESMKTWSGREYWDFMETVDTGWFTRDLPWHYYHVRGVHPARYSEEYNMFIADIIFKNKDKFFSKRDYYFDTYKAPYFTNNMFVSTTDYWRKTLPLFDDGFDEGQLTLQKDIDQSQIRYIRNGFGIHMAYGMTENQQKIQQHYIDNL